MSDPKTNKELERELLDLRLRVVNISRASLSLCEAIQASILENKEEVHKALDEALDALSEAIKGVANG